MCTGALRPELPLNLLDDSQGCCYSSVELLNNHCSNSSTTISNSVAVALVSVFQHDPAYFPLLTQVDDIPHKSRLRERQDKQLPHHMVNIILSGYSYNTCTVLIPNCCHPSFVCLPATPVGSLYVLFQTQGQL